MTGIKLLDDKYALVRVSNLPALVAWELYKQCDSPTTGSCIMSRVWCYLSNIRAYKKHRRKYGSSVLLTVRDGEVI